MPPKGRPRQHGNDPRLARLVGLQHNRQLSAIHAADGSLITRAAWVFTYWGSWRDLQNCFERPTFGGTELAWAVIGGRRISVVYYEAQLEQAPNYNRQNIHGGLHWQGYVEFSEQVSFPQVLAILGWHETEDDEDGNPQRIHQFHLEPRFGRQEEALAYVRKAATAVAAETVQGPVRLQAGNLRVGAPPDVWGQLVQDCSSGALTESEVAEKYPGHYIRFQNAIRNLLSASHQRNNSQRDVRCFFLCGTTGKGKTTLCYLIDPSLYKKIDGQWWCGYRGQQSLLFDDFNCDLPIHVLLQVLDVHPYVVNIRGSTVRAAWQNVFITSNRTWEELYPSALPGHRAALARRIPPEHRFNFDSTSAAEIEQRMRELTFRQPSADLIFDLPQLSVDSRATDSQVSAASANRAMVLGLNMVNSPACSPGYQQPFGSCSVFSSMSRDPSPAPDLSSLQITSGMARRRSRSDEHSGMTQEEDEELTRQAQYILDVNPQVIWRMCSIAEQREKEKMKIVEKNESEKFV